MPRVNGTELNLNPAKSFGSPFLTMEHGSSKVGISYLGYNELIFDFGRSSDSNN